MKWLKNFKSHKEDKALKKDLSIALEKFEILKNRFDEQAREEQRQWASWEAKVEWSNKCIDRLKLEIVQLKAALDKKNFLIQDLQRENSRLIRDLTILEYKKSNKRKVDSKKKK